MTYFSKVKICLLIILVSFYPVFGQEENDKETSKKQKKVSTIVLPIVYYTPETRWAGGVAGVATFRFRNEPLSSSVSSVQFGAAYTQEKQLLLYLPYRLYLKNDKYVFFGELGYYRYSYFFFGIGNHQADSRGELYDVNFPRIKWRGLRQIKSNLYLGLTYDFDLYGIGQVEAGGLLEDPAQNIPGSNGARLSRLGLAAFYDNRDNQFYPTKGIFGESFLQFSHSLTGSNFNYIRFEVDIRAYHKVFQNHILATNFYAGSSWGEVPFNELLLLGGGKRLRGYYEGKFRDKNLLLAQAEYRLPLFWRLKLAAFAGYGMVSSDWGQIKTENFHYSYGAGIRFLLNKEENIHVRFDVGLGEKQQKGFYLTIGEAF